MAKSVPITANHHGAKGGMDNPIKTPVSNAVLSLSVGKIGRLRQAMKIDSVMMAVVHDRNNCTKTP